METAKQRARQDKKKIHPTEKELSKKELTDIRVLMTFVRVYCQNKHRSAPKQALQIDHLKMEPRPDRSRDGLLRRRIRTILKKKDIYCADCTELLTYSINRRLKCPYNPKPACKHCPTHCYRPSYRQTMREVMKFSGIYLVKRGRLDMLWHYYF